MSYSKASLTNDVPDVAAKHGMGEFMAAHFANDALGTEQTGLSFHHVKPGKRQPFGHEHSSAEEVYVVLEGSGQAMLGDELVPLARLEAIKVPADTIRCFEAGDDGLMLLAVGARRAEDQGTVHPGWWGGPGTAS